MKPTFIALTLLFSLSIQAADYVKGHSYLINKVYRSTSNSCDRVQSDVLSRYLQNISKPYPFFFSFDTICFPGAKGVDLEIQLLLEPRSKNEIQTVEEYVIEHQKTEMYGMFIEILPLRQIISDVRVQWRKAPTDFEDAEVKAEHQFLRIHHSFQEAYDFFATQKAMFQKESWDEFYNYLGNFIDAPLLDMTRYYSASRSNEIAALNENFLEAEDGKISAEMGIDHNYRECPDFSKTGKCL